MPLALAQLVFQKAGVGTVARFLAEFPKEDHKKPTLEEIQQRTAEFSEALRRGDIAALVNLLRVQPAA
jgi:hypothetical protein